MALSFSRLDLPAYKCRPELYKEILCDFVRKWFEDAGNDLVIPETALGPDLKILPWISRLKNPKVCCWAEELRASWSELCRFAAADVALTPERHTLIPVSKPFIIPGSRFREGYYWDTYWSIKGLIACEMYDLALSVVSNLVDLVLEIGFVPNGLRTYYLNRSQPPLLAPMVDEIWNATGNLDFLRKALDAVDLELQWWRSAPHTVPILASSGKVHTLSRYYANWEHPRPESYREDMETLSQALSSSKSKYEFYQSNISDEAVCKELFRQIASAAESGWDFSSRWFKDGKYIKTIQTTEVIPADLNSFLYLAGRIASQLAEVIGDSLLHEKWTCFAEERLTAIQELHWDKNSSRWRDLVIRRSNKDNIKPSGPFMVDFLHNNAFYASDWIPLWCGCETAQSINSMKALESLKQSGLVQTGGIAASTVATGEQWDWPNAWPPLQAMLAEACEKYCGEEGIEFAKILAQKYLKSAYNGWLETGKMFEKYDATSIGHPGGGGEYEVVTGFGWSNGIALSWLLKYGSELVDED